MVVPDGAIRGRAHGGRIEQGQGLLADRAWVPTGPIPGVNATGRPLHVGPAAGAGFAAPPGESVHDDDPCWCGDEDLVAGGVEAVHEPVAFGGELAD